MSQKTYRIGEAATKLKLKSYVLRFWETEFPQIAPIRTEKGQRLYTESDLAVLGRIRYLLHERGLTIDGARRLLREEAARGTLRTDPAMTADETLAEEYMDDAPEAMGDTSHADGEGFPGKGTDALPESAAHASVQADLFSASETARPGVIAAASATASPAGSTDASSTIPAVPAVTTDELRAIITELAAIRRLLDATTPGERP